MKVFLQKYRHPILLFALLFVAEILVQPLRNFPLNDDWAYSKSVMILMEQHKIDIGNWGAMTLVTQILWGFLWTKTFGFSFIILRLSTIFSAWTGIFFIYLIGKELLRSERNAIWMAVSFAFLPIFFNLSNTFMTDVNFCTLLILVVYFSLRYFKTENRIHLIILLLFTFPLTFLRQYGIMAPAALLAALILQKKRNWWSIAIVLSGLVLLYFSLRLYEDQLRTYLGQDSSYKFSSGVHPFDKDFYTMVSDRLSARHLTILIQLFFYSSPIAFFFLGSTIRSGNKWQKFASLILTCLFVYWIVPENKILAGNVLENMGLGPETFYQNWHLLQRHYQSPYFLKVTEFMSYLYVGTALFVIIAQSIIQINMVRKNRLNPFWTFNLFLLLGYLLMILVTESYFDRYHLPIILLFVFLVTPLFKSLQLNYVYGLLALSPFIYCSVAGTHDYLEVNEQRWRAYDYLREQGIEKKKINAGFEVNCWSDGELIWWEDFENLRKYDYLVQYDQEPDFVLMKEFPFQSWFPPRKDKISAFKRVQNPQP